MFFAVGVIGIGEGDFGLSVNQALDDFQTLHERMILIAYLVRPRPKSAAGINAVFFESRQNLTQRFIAI